MQSDFSVGLGKEKHVVSACKNCKFLFLAPSPQHSVAVYALPQAELLKDLLLLHGQMFHWCSLTSMSRHRKGLVCVCVCL